MKICSKCKIPKELSEFSKDKHANSGHHSQCKECKKLYNKKYRQSHKEEIKQHRKKYYEDNKEKLLKLQSNYRNKNKKEINKKLKKYYFENKEKHKQYHQENKKRRAKRLFKRYHSNISYKITTILRARLHKSLQGKSKSSLTLKLLGCPIEFLIVHLESQFKKGMSWENHGDWHIDHIKPCAKFDLTKESSQKKCFHYTNLQPLWALDNLKKGSRYEQ